MTQLLRTGYEILCSRVEGLRVLPLTGKVPTGGYKWKHGALDASASALDVLIDTFGDEMTGWGYVLPSGHVVVDLDSLEAMVWAETLPRTLTVRTGKGKHLIYRVGVDVPAKHYEGLDVLGPHSWYLVGPGSLHYRSDEAPSGAVYEVIDDHPVVDLDVEVLNSIPFSSSKSSRSSSGIFGTDAIRELIRENAPTSTKVITSLCRQMMDDTSDHRDARLACVVRSLAATSHTADEVRQIVMGSPIAGRVHKMWDKGNRDYLEAKIRYAFSKEPQGLRLEHNAWFQALLQQGLHQNTTRVAFALFKLFAKHNTSQGPVGSAQMAVLAAMSQPTALRHLKKLVELGYLSDVTRPGRKFDDANVYRLTLPVASLRGDKYLDFSSSKLDAGADHWRCGALSRYFSMVAYLSVCPGSTLDELVDVTQQAERTVKNKLDFLVKQGVVEAVDGHYSLTSLWESAVEEYPLGVLKGIGEVKQREYLSRRESRRVLFGRRKERWVDTSPPSEKKPLLDVRYAAGEYELSYGEWDDPGSYQDFKEDSMDDIPEWAVA